MEIRIRIKKSQVSTDQCRSGYGTLKIGKDEGEKRGMNNKKFDCRGKCTGTSGGVM
jgi:hypothetical protein